MNVSDAKELILSEQRVFLTGKAGTGKSTLLKDIVETIWKKDCLITSTTGISAVNIGWCTLHSVFQMFGDYTVNRKPKALLNIDWKSIKMIVIDEVSMLSPAYLDYIDELLQLNLNNKSPFGWMKMLLIWDLAQLLPIISSEEEMARHKHIYWWVTVDKARTFLHFKTIELTHVFRQSWKLLEIINEVRHGNISNVRLLNSWYGNEKSTHIMPFNSMADKKNSTELAKLKTTSHTFTAKITWEFKTENVITPVILELKVWARVIITKNTKPLVNWDQWTVMKIEWNTVTVFIDRLNKQINISHETWEQKTRVSRNERVKWTFTQIPLKLAYAITIHKSQGMSIENLVIHWTERMDIRLLYVALSRATNEETLFIHKC